MKVNISIKIKHPSFECRPLYESLRYIYSLIDVVNNNIPQQNLNNMSKVES